MLNPSKQPDTHGKTKQASRIHNHFNRSALSIRIIDTITLTLSQRLSATKTTGKDFPSTRSTAEEQFQSIFAQRTRYNRDKTVTDALISLLFHNHCQSVRQSPSIHPEHLSLQHCRRASQIKRLFIMAAALVVLSRPSCPRDACMSSLHYTGCPQSIILFICNN